MQQHIGGTKAMAWVEHITLSLNPQVKRTKELEEFIKRPSLLSDPGEPLNATTRRQMETFFGYNFEDVLVHHGYQAEEASRQMSARAFTIGSHIFGSHQALDTSTQEGQGLLAHELTHVIQQTQPHQLPQGSSEAKDDFTLPAMSQKTSPGETAPPANHADIEMSLPAHLKNSPATTSPQQREAQAQTSEQMVTEGLANNTKPSPQINLEEVASKVYRLMQDDLIMERERATKLGG